MLDDVWCGGVLATQVCRHMYLDGLLPVRGVRHRDFVVLCGLPLHCDIILYPLVCAWRTVGYCAGIDLALSFANVFVSLDLDGW